MEGRIVSYRFIRNVPGLPRLVFLYLLFLPFGFFRLLITCSFGSRGQMVHGLWFRQDKGGLCWSRFLRTLLEIFTQGVLLTGTLDIWLGLAFSC